jgi:hypothetical protein
MSEYGAADTHCKLLDFSDLKRIRLHQAPGQPASATKLSGLQIPGDPPRGGGIEDRAQPQ